MPAFEHILEKDGLPASLHLERVVLGALLSDPDYNTHVYTTIREEDFSVDNHRQFFRAMRKLKVERNVDADFASLAECFTKQELDALGGRATIIALTEGLPRHLNVENYARVLRDKNLLRQVLASCEEAMYRAAQQSEDPRVILNDLAEKVNEIGAEESTGEMSMADQSAQAWEKLQKTASGEQLAFIPTGVESLDDSHGGYAIGEFTVIGARPNVGKSTLLRQGLISNCTAGNFVHLFTPEMSSDQVHFCLWAFMADIPFHKVRHPERLTGDDWRMIRKAKAAVDEWPLYVDQTAQISAPELINRARAKKRKHNTKLVGLDYLQKLRYRGRSQERHVEVTDSAVALAGFAKVEQIALVAISSITEPGEKNRNRPPTIQDFRQSGDIQYEANTALLLHREFEDESQQLQPKTSLIVGKGRSDPTGSRTLYFMGAQQQFVSEETYMRSLGR